MTVTAFAPVIESRAFDESKHVNYTLGMLLGVDDFHQEFAYLAGRTRRLARDASGYGTVVGLAVSIDTKDDAKGARIIVESGAGITPKGQFVCVRPSQCAYLDEWLAAKRKELEKEGVTVPSNIDANVVLAYRDCPSDPVLLPGEACRDDKELSVDSRISDSFTLELRRDAPVQNEENAVRAFIAWMQKIPFGGVGPFLDAAAFEKLMRDSVKEPKIEDDETRNTGWIPITFTDPPATARLDAATAREMFGVAMRVWTTHIRALVHPLCTGGCGCCGPKHHDFVEPDDLLLLAKVTMPVKAADNGDWVIDRDQLATLKLDESNRPLLLHTRMVQELSAMALAMAAK